MIELAPIVLFVYNRLWHTQQTIEALKMNDLAKESNLVIYSDFESNKTVSEKVKEVRKYIKTITGFKSVTIIERDENWGLARSIMDGVSEIVDRYGKVIVLEDDIVTSPEFLKFMNEALNFYHKKEKIWHISGWNYPIDSKELGETFLWRGMSCWGWATWADRWKHFKKEPEQLVENWTREDKMKFDLDGLGEFWNQVELNLSGKINTWAIFWYASIYQNNGLCLNPSVSYVENIGHDDSGVHCGANDNYSIAELNKKQVVTFPEQMIESSKAVSLIKNFYKAQKKPLLVRILRKLGRIFSDIVGVK